MVSRWFPMIFTRYEDVITSAFSFLQVIRETANALGVRADTVAERVEV